MIVTLPNFFRAFVKETPRVNPHYHAVKIPSEEWLAESVYPSPVLGDEVNVGHRKCSFSASMRRKVELCDFSLFCSIAAPEAPEDKLRTMCDWGNWVSWHDP
jgi:hypothetical protein